MGQAVSSLMKMEEPVFEKQLLPMEEWLLRRKPALHNPTLQKHYYTTTKLH